MFQALSAKNGAIRPHYFATSTSYLEKMGPLGHILFRLPARHLMHFFQDILILKKCLLILKKWAHVGPCFQDNHACLQGHHLCCLFQDPYLEKMGRKGDSLSAKNAPKCALFAALTVLVDVFHVRKHDISRHITYNHTQNLHLQAV